MRARPYAVPIALALIGTLSLAACSQDGDVVASGENVPANATKEQYLAAFEDVDPITLITQTAGAQGSLTSSYFEEYEAAITEWSGGKIEFDTNYAYSVATPTESSDAVADGRLDLTYISPTYQPEELPAVNAITDMTPFANHTSLVGLLQQVGWVIEASASSEQVLAEYEALGLHPVLPVYSLGPDALYCAEERTSLADFDGVSTRMSARFHAGQFSALGISGVTIELSEIFEALQRGVVECAVANPTVAVLTGIYESAPHAGTTATTGLGGGVGALVINQDVWKSLPLPAQQLLHDRLDVFIKQQISITLGGVAQVIEETRKNGGDLRLFDPEVAEVLKEANDKSLESSRAEIKGIDDPNAFIDERLTELDRWLGIVTDLGFDPEMTPDEFLAWHADHEESDFDPIVEQVLSDTMSSYRPGSAT